MPSYAITGASGGIGFGFVRQLASDPANSVFALVRDPESIELQQFVKVHKYKNIHVVRADIGDYGSIKTAADEVSRLTEGKLDVLINNAAMMGVQERGRFTVLDYPDDETLESDLISFFRTNVVGTTHTINSFLPLIRAGEAKKVIVISSEMGSPLFALKTEVSGGIGYSVSKAGLNMMVAKYAVSCKKDGIIFLAVSPGLVKTRKGLKEQLDVTYEAISNQIRVGWPTYKGAITVEESVRDNVELFKRITLADSGRFVRRNGVDANSTEDDHL